MADRGQLSCGPIVVRADAETDVWFEMAPGTECPQVVDVTCFHLESLRRTECRVSSGARRGPSGAICVRLAFPGEQEHAIEVRAGEQLLFSARVYSVKADLYSLHPLRGDFHIHTNRSDGTEPPPIVAAECRRIGLDFVAITDHHRYAPSLEAIDAFRNVPIDLRLYPGEEVHPPDNHQVHMINFGGRRSVCEMFREEAFRRETAVIAAGLPDTLDDSLRYIYASAVWSYRKIREAGGLSVFCHPYWISEGTYCVPESLIALHFEQMPFDAYEVIGGYPRVEMPSNGLQVSRYHEERARGRRIPIVGASDAHGCRNGQLFGWYSTIVFAPSADLEAIVAAVRGLNSVACETIPGETPRFHAPHRLARYAAFLHREYFPAHDALCEEEGQAMLDYLGGDAGAVLRLAGMRGRTEELWRRARA